MKKTYDIVIHSSGVVKAFYYGFFDQRFIKTDRDEFVIVECEKCFYRVNKYDIQKPAIVRFLERAKKI